MNMNNRYRAKENVLWPPRASALLVPALSFVVAFTFMGTAGARLFLGTFLLLSAFYFALAAVVYRTNWFEFDDDHKRLVKAFHHHILYDRIKSIVIRELLSRTSITVRSGRLHAVQLIGGLRREEAEIIGKELEIRFPGKIMKKNRVAVLHLLLGLVIVLAFSGFLYSVYQFRPKIHATVEKKNWLTADYPVRGSRYFINNIGFVVPERFKKVKEEGESIIFEDKTGKTQIIAEPGSLELRNFTRNRVIAYVSGFNTVYDFYNLAYTARFGLIPYLINNALFEEISEIKIYEANRETLRSIALEGVKDDKSLAHIIVDDDNGEIGFYISQPRDRGKIKEKLLRSIVESIQPSRGRDERRRSAVRVQTDRQ